MTTTISGNRFFARQRFDLAYMEPPLRLYTFDRVKENVRDRTEYSPTQVEQQIQFLALASWLAKAEGRVLRRPIPELQPLIKRKGF